MEEDEDIFSPDVPKEKQKIETPVPIPMVVGVQSGNSRSKFLRRLESYLGLMQIDQNSNSETPTYSFIGLDDGEIYEIQVMTIDTEDVLSCLRDNIIDLFAGTEEFLYSLQEHDCDLVRIDRCDPSKDEQVGTISLLEGKNFTIQGSKRVVTKFSNWEKLLYHAGSSCSTQELKDELEKTSYWLPIEEDFRICGSVREFLKYPHFCYGIEAIHFSDKPPNNDQAKVVLPLRKLFAGLWIHGQNLIGRNIFRQFSNNGLCVYIEGTDGTGKTTTTKLLKKDRDFVNHLICDRNEFITSQMIHMDLEELPKELHLALKTKSLMVILLSCRPTISLERIEKRNYVRDDWENPATQHYLHRKYLELAFHYGWPIIDTGESTASQVAQNIKRIACHNLDTFSSQNVSMPIMSQFDDVKFDSLKPLPEKGPYESFGWESRCFNGQLDILKSQQEQDTTALRYLLYILALEQIEHNFVYVGKKFIVEISLDATALSVSEKGKQGNFVITLSTGSDIEDINSVSVASIGGNVLFALQKHLSPEILKIGKIYMTISKATSHVCGFIFDENRIPLHRVLEKNPSFLKKARKIIEINVLDKYR